MSVELIRIRSGQQICRAILLSDRGKVMVRTGQHVEIGDVIAESIAPAEFYIFDLVNGLKIKPNKVESCIERLIGEQIEEGDIIAQTKGLLPRIFRSPGDGRLISIHDGKVTLALGETRESVTANIPGVIVELISERGAVICCQGDVLQGVWGNGLNGQGELVLLSNFDEDPFENSAQLKELAGKIVVMDTCSNKNRLSVLKSVPVGGIVVGSLSPLLLEDVEQLSIPVMSLTGFGDSLIDPVSEAMLQAMAGKNTIINANIPDLYTGLKPELIMPSPATSADGLFVDENRIELGTKVRLIGKPYTGSVGTIIELPEEPETFASGLKLTPAVIERFDGEIIRVPITNFEVIVE